MLLTEAARPYEKTQNEEMAGKRERGRESERGRETKLAARFPQNPLFLEALTSGDKYSRVDTHIPVDSLMRSEVCRRQVLQTNGFSNASETTYPKAIKFRAPPIPGDGGRSIPFENPPGYGFPRSTCPDPS